jgi:hypothetical protein
MTAKVLPWAYSTLTAFETCPRRYYLTKIAKSVHEPQTDATLHGNAVHKAFERHLKGTERMPVKYQQYIPIADSAKQRDGKKLIEWRFALTDSFKPTGFFDADAWVRGVIDYGLIQGDEATLLDWKTGKPKDDVDQLKLFAAVTFSTYSYVNSARCGYVWLGANSLDKETYAREDVPGIWGEFLPRVQRLRKAAEDGKFGPKPSGLCKEWCPVPHSMCEHSGKR